MKYKLIAVDFDGTLIKSDSTISHAQLHAIKDFIFRGGIFVVITGRMTASILPILRNLGLQGLVASFNGGEITDITSGEHVYTSNIKNSIATEIFTLAEKHGVYAHGYHNELYFAEKYTHITEWYERITGVKCQILNKKLSSYFGDNNYDTNKILIMDEKENCDRIFPYLLPFNDRLNVIRSNANQIEITDKGTSKAGALDYLAKRFNIPLSETIAVGDGGNDASMLAFAGLGIAVANAEIEAKQSAKLVLNKTNDQDAVKEIINKYTF